MGRGLYISNGNAKIWFMRDGFSRLPWWPMRNETPARAALAIECAGDERQAPGPEVAAPRKILNEKQVLEIKEEIVYISAL